jgi:hypothetical protein
MDERDPRGNRHETERRARRARASRPSRLRRGGRPAEADPRLGPRVAGRNLLCTSARVAHGPRRAGGSGSRPGRARRSPTSSRGRGDARPPRASCRADSPRRSTEV